MSTQQFTDGQAKQLREIARKHQELLEYSPMAASAYVKGELKDKDVKEFKDILSA